MEPILAKRRQQRIDGSMAYNDAIEWFEEESQGRCCDPVATQLHLSLATIHTTTDLICQTLIELVQNPEIMNLLRTEMVTAIQETGWEKTSFQRMKLLDSVIKETLRVKPNAISQLSRKPEKYVPILTAYSFLASRSA